MTREQAQFLKAACDWAGDQDCEIQDDYSGRGMYGKTTHAVVASCTLTELLCTALNFAMHGGEHLYPPGQEREYPLFGGLRTDQMGRDSIVVY